MGETGIVYCSRDGKRGKGWNCIVGCTPAPNSTGCRSCWARELHTKRHLAWLNGWTTAPKQYHKPFSEVQFFPERLDEPLHWRKPQVVFVTPQSDLFHASVPDAMIEAAWQVMASTQQHTYLVVTKRLDRARNIVCRMRNHRPHREYSLGGSECPNPPYLPNVALIASVSTQADADRLIPTLLSIPAKWHGVSAEPQIEEIDFYPYVCGETEVIVERGGCCERLDPEGNVYWSDERYMEREREQAPALDFIIQGCESGPNRRPFDPTWARKTRDECAAAGTCYCLKQMEIDGKVVELPELDGVRHDSLPWNQEARR
jgi:protein gp37